MRKKVLTPLEKYLPPLQIRLFLEKLKGEIFFFFVRRTFFTFFPPEVKLKHPTTAHSSGMFYYLLFIF